MSTHTHSTAALSDITADGSLGRRATYILQAARQRAEDNPDNPAFTDRDMLRILGYSDPNAVRPRITELIGMGLLIEVDAVRDSVTGKTVRRSRAATAREITLWRQRHDTTSPRQLDLL